MRVYHHPLHYNCRHLLSSTAFHLLLIWGVRICLWNQAQDKQGTIDSKHMYLPSRSSKETERPIDHVDDVRIEKEQDNVEDESLHKKTAVSSSQASVPSNSRVSLTHIKSPPLKGHLQHDSKELSVHVLHDTQPVSLMNLRPPVSVCYYHHNVQRIQCRSFQ